MDRHGCCKGQPENSAKLLLSSAHQGFLAHEVSNQISVNVDALQTQCCNIPVITALSPGTAHFAHENNIVVAMKLSNIR